MAGTSSGIVAGLTLAAVGTVGFLAYQAHTSAPPSLSGRPGATASLASPSSSAGTPGHGSTALPARSGRGERVVYSLSDDRVWLVDRAGRVERTFPVTPGTVRPSPGAYWVTSRSNAVTGTDGTPIEHVVRFTGVDGLAIGFSAAIAAPASADPTARTGGIRESRPDGVAMWNFATIGVPVIVVRQPGDRG